MRNYFTLNGVDSRDFGVYISGQGTFNASARDYNVIPVPGRNGDLVGPEKRFQNGTLTYPAFIYSNFKKNVEDFRNFLLSLVGYHDLVDSYHPDEIRKVLFRGPFETEVETKNDAGRFDIVFECKPQRFLASGNEVTTFEPTSETETFSGSIVTFDNPGGATVSALSTAINPIQDLHGYDSPWPAGGGKNLWPYPYDVTKPTFYATAWNGTTIDGEWVVQTGHSIAIGGFGGACFYSVPAGTYTISVDVDASQAVDNKYAVTILTKYSGESTYSQSGQYSNTASKYTKTITLTGDADCIAIRIASHGNSRTAVVRYKNIQLELGSSATAYAPYSNICPISGWTGANIVVSPTLDAQDGTTYTVSWQTEAGTVYGGTLDVLTGVLTVDRAMLLYDGSQDENITLQSINSYNIADFNMNGGINLPNYKTGTNNFINNRFDYQTSTIANTQTEGMYINNAGQAFLRVKSSVASTVAELKTWLASNNLQVCYELATPQTYQLTPTEVAMLTGANNVWSDTGDITATIVFPQDQFTITNPTLFPSQPLMRVYGVGALGVGSQTVTITQADVYTDIDCEMMDAFKGTANKNPYVQLTDHNFPVFKPGVNNISLGTGITKVEITPRWWIV